MGSFFRSDGDDFVLHPGTCGAHDHPFAVALLEEIHPDRLTASVHPVTHPLFGDTAVAHGNIAEYLHIHWTVFKRLDFVMEGCEITQPVLVVTLPEAPTVAKSSA